MIREALTVYGRVQGVGYRYYTYQKALQMNLSGFVKNNPDGSVYIEVQGAEEVISDFKELLEEGPSVAAVSEITSKSLPVKSGCSTFEIKH